MPKIEDVMHDLKEMIRKQAEEIERMNKEWEAWKKQQDEFQSILINLGMRQQPPATRKPARGEKPPNGEASLHSRTANPAISSR
jgi:hypothetical protein